MRTDVRIVSAFDHAACGGAGSNARSCINTIDSHERADKIPRLVIAGQHPGLR